MDIDRLVTKDSTFQFSKVTILILQRMWQFSSLNLSELLHEGGAFVPVNFHALR